MHSARKEIQKQGYTRCEGVFNAEEVADLLLRVKTLQNTFSPPDVSSVPKLNQGHSIVYSVETKDIEIFRALIGKQEVVDVLKFFLNDQWYTQIPKDDPNFILRAMIARTGGPQTLPLHIDSFIPSSGHLPFVMQVSVVLETQTIENGCTFCVPGSHLWDRYADNNIDMKDIVPLVANAGDVVVWDSRLFHGAYPNLTEHTRWSLVATFTRWWIKQNYQTLRSMRQDVMTTLSTTERAILGFYCDPPLNEYERIDIKSGYLN